MFEILRNSIVDQISSPIIALYKSQKDKKELYPHPKSSQKSNEQPGIKPHHAKSASKDSFYGLEECEI